MSASPVDVSEPAFRVEISVQDDATFVRCIGKLKAGVTEILRNAVKPLVASKKRVVLDLTDLTQMDSMGLGTVVSLYVSAKASGSKLELVNLSKGIRQVLSVTNVLSLFEVYGENPIRLP